MKYKPDLSIKLGGWNFAAAGGVLRIPLYAASKIPELIR